MANTLDQPLNQPMVLGNRFARLVTTADGHVTALFVGAVAGASEVWVRLVDEEALLLEGGHSSRPAEILIGVQNDAEVAWRHIDDVVRTSQATSVHVAGHPDGDETRATPGPGRRCAYSFVACPNRRAPGSSGSRSEFTS
jgi:hypothetical protein